MAVSKTDKKMSENKLAQRQIINMKKIEVKTLLSIQFNRNCLNHRVTPRYIAQFHRINKNFESARRLIMNEIKRLEQKLYNIHHSLNNRISTSNLYECTHFQSVLKKVEKAEYEKIKTRHEKKFKNLRDSRNSQKQKPGKTKIYNFSKRKLPHELISILENRSLDAFISIPIDNVKISNTYDTFLKHISEAKLS